MKKPQVRDYPFIQPARGIRRVRWENLPLGSIILEWTTIHGSSIPELAEYPVITERIRHKLHSRYQFLADTTVTIADPDSGIDRERIMKAAGDSLILGGVFPEVERFREGLRRQWLADPGARSGLSRVSAYDGGPYILTKDWARSVGTIIKEDTAFGSALLNRENKPETPGSMISRLLTSGIRLPDANESAVHLGLDISFSMTSAGKAGFVYNNLQELLSVTAEKLRISTWNLWLLSDDVTPGNWRYPLEGAGDLDAMLRRQSAVSGNTNFAPFFRKVLETKNRFKNNLCILVTDGVCQDRPAALRTAEMLAGEGIDYLQLVIHQDEEYRKGVITENPENSTDGVTPEELISETDTLFERNDDELRKYCDNRLREVTDIAEAAKGGQLIMTWYPLFSYISLDVYSRWLGTVSTG